LGSACTLAGPTIAPRLYSTEQKLEELYSLLVKESLGREDVSSMETENVRCRQQQGSMQ
jgi:hypothetical protein